MTTTYNAIGVLTIQAPWFCDCDRAYRWARPAVWKRTGRCPRLVSVLAAIRDQIIPSGDEPTYVLNGWTCDCGRGYERDDSDLLCCDWVMVDGPPPPSEQPCGCGGDHALSEHWFGPVAS